MPYGTPEALVAACEPLAAHINRTWPGVFFVPAPTGAAGPEDHASWWSWFKLHYDTSPAGGHTILGSWLLDGKALANDRNATARAVGRFIGGEGKGALLNFVGGKGVMEAKPRGGGTAVLPAWRKAYLHPITGVGFPPLDSSAKAAAVSTLRDRVAALRELAPDMGAYVNEANPYEPDWQHAFWGANYARLRSIKRSVDPDDVLWCHPCVGNEDWKEVDGQLCRV
ncbi:isoamyl alcohol oxidase [Magnaporthiopsis poae ATCC 64411]|uniref:Isoamyl alcohol oxidase n=1 Tax=Magnaporthiopsis poae (strain ATCC 64411 / 73-15) TaxID=644358 RepID=A0A0C4DQQ1_MAGP6|nr:isoamyl alcohol oxidase [Magnaporthiopsis poae ATCC 64411]